MLYCLIKLFPSRGAVCGRSISETVHDINIAEPSRVRLLNICTATRYLKTCIFLGNTEKYSLCMKPWSYKTKFYLTGVWCVCATRSGDRPAFVNWRCISDKNMPKKLKIKLYMSVIRPVRLYGAECWIVRKKEEEILDKTDMRMLRRIKGVTLRDKIMSAETN